MEKKTHWTYRLVFVLLAVAGGIFIGVIISLLAKVSPWGAIILLLFMGGTVVGMLSEKGDKS